MCVQNRGDPAIESPSRFCWVRVKIALEPVMIRTLARKVLVGTLVAFQAGASQGQIAIARSHPPPARDEHYS
jgi:hypothetical protein